MVVHRFEVYLVRLDPAVGSEIQKTSPCVIITPDELNRQFNTVILAPMTSASHSFQTRIPCHFDMKASFVVLDQIRSVDKSRLIRRVGNLTLSESSAVLSTLVEIFTL